MLYSIFSGAPRLSDGNLILLFASAQEGKTSAFSKFTHLELVLRRGSSERGFIFVSEIAVSCVADETLSQLLRLRCRVPSDSRSLNMSAHFWQDPERLDMAVAGRRLSSTDNKLSAPRCGLQVDRWEEGRVGSGGLNLKILVYSLVDGSIVAPFVLFWFCLTARLTGTVEIRRDCHLRAKVPEAWRLCFGLLCRTGQSLKVSKPPEQFSLEKSLDSRPHAREC